MIDTHAHLHDKQFDEDRAAAFARARVAGVKRIVSIGCDVADSGRALKVAREFDCYASVGIHPHEAKDAPRDIAEAFLPFLSDARVVAIGETGLDYYYAHSPPEAQKAVLRAQIRLARKRALPVIFHHRDAYDEFVAILREEFVPGMRGVIHCFTGDTHQARTYVDEFGLLLGIGGVVTFKTAEPIREAVRTVGLDALVLETDCPYLAPIPHRGKRNEPAFIVHTAAKVGDVLGLKVDEVSSVTDRNARDLFRIPPE